MQLAMKPGVWMRLTGASRIPPPRPLFAAAALLPYIDAGLGGRSGSTGGGAVRNCLDHGAH